MTTTPPPLLLGYKLPLFLDVLWVELYLSSPLQNPMVATLSWIAFALPTLTSAMSNFSSIGVSGFVPGELRLAVCHVLQFIGTVHGWAWDLECSLGQWVKWGWGKQLWNSREFLPPFALVIAIFDIFRYNHCLIADQSTTLWPILCAWLGLQDTN